MNVPVKYIPKRLSKRDKVKQTKQLKKSRLAYKKGKYIHRKPVKSFTSKKSQHIINAEKIKLTGKKLDDKTYYRHTGYPGGIKSINARKILEGKFPDRLVRLAVKRMIPKGPLGRKQLSNMKVYVGDKHPHEAQNPKTYNIQDVV